MANISRTKKSAKWVYSFSPKGIDKTASKDKEYLINLLGGKGAHLMEMCQLKLPVPPGFVISTDVCSAFYENDQECPKALKTEVQKALGQLEKSSGKKFGAATNPLLISVRSGARVSMPGMMDTVLNLGLNDETVCGLIKVSHNERFAYDCYRRFIQMYSNVVLGVDHHEFEELLDHKKLSVNAARDTDLTAAHLKDLVAQYQALVKQKNRPHVSAESNGTIMGCHHGRI
jgi:pyruvate,orthophosphate dikinase